jgi:hypothetical protein
VARALSPVPQDRWPSCGELLVELERVTAPEQPADAAARGERRKEPRYRADAAAVCEVLPTLGNEAWQAQLQNLSAGGARLRIARPGFSLRPGRVLEVALSCAARGLRVQVRLRLTHCAECAAGDYEVGGCFDSPLRAEDLAALIQDSPA